MTHQNIRQTLLGRKARLLVVAVGMLIVLIIPAFASAATESFNVLNGSPQSGMLMSLTANPGVVEPANNDNSKSLVGVIAPNESSFDQQPGQISVKTDGASNALVSTLGGDIRVGDRITTSAIEGVGAKTTVSAWIVGVAQGSLDAQTKGAIQTSVTDSGGTKHTVYVANIPVLVKITYYNTATTAAATAQTTIVPNIIQRIADTIAGKHVSTRALILSFVLFVIGVVLAAMLINSAVRGGFVAISRQPLAKAVIFRGVWRSVGFAFGILAFVIAAVVLMLRLL